MELKVYTRQLRHSDLEGINNILNDISQFNKEEKVCAIELAEASLKEQDTKEYEFLVAVDEQDKIYGFVSFSDIPLTDNCYDLYWIVTNAKLQNKGVGTKLINELLKILKKRGVRKLFTETSSQDGYKLTRSFYEKRGFKLIADIPDFYKIGDNKMIYVKNL